MPEGKRLIAVLVLLLLIACSKEKSQDSPVVGKDMPDEVFSDFVTQESDSGKIKWKLTAPRADKYKSKKLVVLDKPTIKFFDEKGRVKTTLTADQGEFYQDSQDMLAYGKVVVVSEEGNVLETDSLYWVNSSEKIVSNGYVKITRENDVLTGIGLECDNTLSSINIKNNVRARIIERGKEK